jgi:hypothetical protein
LISLEEAGSKEEQNLIVQRQNAEANFVKAKDGLSKQQEQINYKNFNDDF